MIKTKKNYYEKQGTAHIPTLSNQTISISKIQELFTDQELGKTVIGK